MSTELIVIRHGESNYNRERRWQGQSQDAILNALGWRQAACLADALRGTHPAALFSSELTRAMQTAVPIAAAVNLPIYPEPRLREISAGSWTNRYADEVRRAEPERLLGPPSEDHLAPLGKEGITLGSAGGPGPVVA